MKLIEYNMKFRGEFNIYLEENSLRILHYSNKNVILNECGEAFAYCCKDGDYISDIELGYDNYGGYDDEHPFLAGPNSSLSGLVSTVPISIAENDYLDRVILSFILEESDYNGNSYTVASLLTSGGYNVAIHTFPVIEKTSDRRITFEWTLIFDNE